MHLRAGASGPADVVAHGCPLAWADCVILCHSALILCKSEAGAGGASVYGSVLDTGLPQHPDACASAGQVLAVLLTQPCMAAAHSRLAWALGRGIGEYLLQQVDWALQVPPPPLHACWLCAFRGQDAELFCARA